MRYTVFFENCPLEQRSNVQLFLFSEIFDTMEGGIIGIVEVICAIDRRAAKIKDVISFKEEIHILQTDFFMIHITEIIKVTLNFPMQEIFGNHERK